MIRMNSVYPRLATLRALAMALTVVFTSGPALAAPEEYVCPPCSLPCDAKVHDKPGACPDCGMSLIERPPAGAPQTTCPVMGGPINEELYVDYEGKRIYVCCYGCLGEIKADPAKYLKKLEEMGQSARPVPGAER